MKRVKTTVITLIAVTLSTGQAAMPQTLNSRSADANESLVRLSVVLGRIHALQVLCNGRTDQFWRDQMSQLLTLEAPDDGPVRRTLIESFNTSYSVQESETPQCDGKARSVFNTLAEEGQSLSETLNSAISNGN